MKNNKLFRDPIHGFINVSDCALEIINDPFFQRLRHIKQLSFTHLVFHGAEHSRFGHSMGVYHLANTINDNLHPSAPEQIKEEFSLAALLHDIGHHPFSHSFENVMKSFSEEVGVESDHEKYTINIINKTNIGKIINEYGYDHNHIIQLLNGAFTDIPEMSYLNDLISSEFDLDRLDYLLRDSYYCGVMYGNIDLERIFMNINIDNGRIIIDEKGLHSAEMYVLARFYMYTQVYTHKTTRAFDLMLNKIIDKNVFLKMKYPKLEDNGFNKFLEIDDSWLINWLKKLSNSPTFKYSNLAKQIINRIPIRVVAECHALVRREDSSLQRDFSTLSDLKDDIKFLANKIGIDEEYIFIDEPWHNLPFDSRYRPYIVSNNTTDHEEGVEKSPILIKTKTGIKDIAAIPSSLAFSIARQEAQVVRIYTLQEYRNKLADAIKEHRPKITPYLWYDK